MQGGVRVLILEDDENLRAVLASVLEANGYLVEVAARGDEALTLARQTPPDVVVADIRMQGMDGLDTLERVGEEHPGVPRMVITGYSTEADSIRAIHLGVDNYLKKPFTMDEFLKAVRALVVLRHEAQAQLEQERSLRRTLLWALEALARSLESTRPALRDIGSRTGSLCESLGLSHDITQTVQVATLMALTGFRGVDPDGLPATLKRILTCLEERWDGTGPEGLSGSAIPFEARLVGILLAWAEEGAGLSGIGSYLAQAYPGRFDPTILAALDGTAQVPVRSGRERRSLAWLARALETAGHLEAARSAYQELSEGSRSDRETVLALQGLSRLSPVPERREYLLQAVSLAEQVGPLLAGSLYLEAGLALSDAELVRRGERFYAELSDENGRARCRLALESLGESATDELFRSALEQLITSGGLEQSGSWLLSLLADQVQRPGAERALRLLVEARPWEAAALAERLPESLRRSTGVEPTERATRWKVYSMGCFEVFRGGERLPESSFKTQKLKYILAWLATQPGRSLIEDRLIEAFWPTDLEKGKRSLHWSVSMLRRAMRVGDDPVDPILRLHGGYQLNPELAVWHDYQELTSLLEECLTALRAGRSPGEQASRQLLDLYRGPYLEGCYLDWALALRTRLERQAQEVMLALAELGLRQDRLREALELAERVLEIDACCQEAHLGAIRALVGLGRAPEAVRQYQACERALRVELGMEPSLALLEWHQRALLAVG